MLFDFFYKYLFSKRAGALVKRISWLSVIGLCISVTALVLVLSVMTALNKNIQDRTLAVEPHLTIEIPGVSSAELLEAHPLVAKLHENMDVEVDVYERQDVIVRTLDGHFGGAIARGMTQPSLNTMMKEISKLNKLTSQLPLQTEVLAPGEILIGVDMAVSLGVFEGDPLLVVPPEGLLLPPTEIPRFERVTVKKIISTNLADVDAQNIFYIRGQTFRSFRSAHSRRVGVEVKVPDPARADSYKEDLKFFPEARIQTWKERNSALFLALRLEKTAMAIFLGLAGLLAIFSMISVMVLLISQKRKEIGLLQALGFSTFRVQKLFMWIGILLGAMGLGSGLLLGSGISYWIELHPLNILPDIYYDSQIPAELDLSLVLVILLVGAAISVVGSRLSSKAAAKVTPSEAIRNV